MSAVFIDRRDAELDLDGGAMDVRVDGRRIAAIPLAGTERVVVRQAGSLSVRLLAALGERQVGLFVLGGRKGEPRAHLLGMPQRDALVRLGQYRLALDPALSLPLARFAVKGKLQGHLDLLRHAAGWRDDCRRPLSHAAAEIEALLERLPAAGEVGVLRGMEGAGAASFFRAYTALFAPALGFSARRRRPPPDPVNAALSLAYTLLHAEAVRAAWCAGLDPFIGFLHAPLPGRESCAADLVELSRPAADRWVWGLFRGRLLRPDHFTTVDGACLLGKAGRALFYREFDLLLATERRRLRHAAAVFVRAARAAGQGGGAVQG